MKNIKKDNREIKDRLFQYATEKGCFTKGYSLSMGTEIYEDTELITEEEANKLWEKYKPQLIKDLENGDRPQMCIWKNCENNTHYNEIEKEIDWRDRLEITNGEIYKLEKTKL